MNAAAFDLSGRTALVTGCRRGIGKAIAVALAAAGADVVGVSATLEEGSEVAAAVEAHGRSFVGYRFDFGNRAEVHELVATVRRDHERIDILVNNAGTIARAPAAEHPDELWDHVLEVNLTAQFIVARDLGRDMVARGNGKIVFIASLLSFQGGIDVPGYTASKSGVAGLTKALANEWASHGVNVNAVAPGTFRATTRRHFATTRSASTRSSPHSAGRWADADDIAGAVVFLRSPAADYVDGIVLPVDGGCLAGERGSRVSEETVLATLGRARIIPVVALDDAAVVADLCAALQAGGIFTVEITFRTAERRPHSNGRRRSTGWSSAPGRC